MSGRYRRLNRFLALAMFAIGTAIVMRTIQHGGGALSIGFIFGACLAGVGLVRLVAAVGSGMTGRVGPAEDDEVARPGVEARRGGRG